MAWLLEGNPLRKILVTRLRYLGDVVMSTVVLQALRDGDPDVSLGFLCEAEYGPALTGHPLVDTLHLLGSRRRGSDARARIRSTDEGNSPAGFRTTIGRLRAARYDLAVDLFFNPRSAWLLRFGGMPYRIGGTTGSRRHLYTHVSRPEDLAAHQSDWSRFAPGGLGHHLSRLAPLVHGPTGLGFVDWFRAHGSGPPLPSLASPAVGNALLTALGNLGLGVEQPFLLLAPGATWPSKAWPDTRWADLVLSLTAQYGLPSVVLVPPGRETSWPELAKAAAGAGGGVLPPLSLTHALALVARARLLVSVDGGIMHAGVGLGVPTVGVFGPTDPDQWFPYDAAGPFRVVAGRPSCHPCHLHTCDHFICLPDLPAAAVLEAANTLLADGVEA